MGRFDDEMDAEALRRTHEAVRQAGAEAAAEREAQDAYSRDIELIREFVQTMRSRGILPQTSSWPTVRRTKFRKQEVPGKSVLLDGWLINKPAASANGYVREPAVLGLCVTREAAALVGVAQTLVVRPFDKDGYPECYRWDPLDIDHYRGFAAWERIYSGDWYMGRNILKECFASDWVESSLLGYVRRLQ